MCLARAGRMPQGCECDARVLAGLRRTNASAALSEAEGRDLAASNQQASLVLLFHG